ncbi:threonine/serine dehydratase [Hyphococcus sp. DH-69]|uniref:threonine ammonia-lyase n=1 Tax=Hyphococcus formosus TaxID=3143534 RepID=UPI00398B8DAF
MLSKTEDLALISADGVMRAAERLKGKAIRTPLIESVVLNEAVGGRVIIKPEVLQHYGSFKFRGAYNLLSQLAPEARERGVIAWSSGNHAQGVAFAAKLLGINATIVMPEDAPKIKAENVKRLGANIVTYDRYTEDREEVARPIIEKYGLAIAPPFDHPHTIEGQGTMALETFEDALERETDLDSFIICCGGGGLTAGSALALEAVSPDTEVWISEPEHYDETWATIRDGKPQIADVSRWTLCDAIATPQPGKLTLPIMERLVRGGVAVTESDIRAAMIFAFQNLKLVVEPGGAAALAAILSGKFDGRGKTTAIVLSGGNVDPAIFSAILDGQPIPRK